MNDCPNELAVVRASRKGELTDELREHVARCRDCAAAASVSGWMTQFSGLSEREHRLPDPSLVWLKAQLLRAPADAARVARPLNIVQMIAYFLVAGGWAALLTWKWAALQALLYRLTPAGLVHTAAHAETLSMSLFALLFILASVTVVLALHTILTEE